MEKDPEDVRYNFIRWLNNDVGTAIGPSRVHPETGEILDADIVLTDGWIRHFNFNYHDLMPKLAMEGVSSRNAGLAGAKTRAGTHVFAWRRPDKRELPPSTNSPTKRMQPMAATRWQPPTRR